MFRLMVKCAAIPLLLLFAGSGVSAAERVGSTAARLDSPGQAVEVRGLRTRVIAFYDDGGRERVDLTILLGGGVLGNEVLRSRVSLRDGQSHSVVMDAGDADGAVERYRFTREGDSLSIAFDPGLGAPALTVGRVEAASGPTEPGDGAEPQTVIADLAQ